MSILNKKTSRGKKRLRADTFVSENCSRIRRRLFDFGDRLHSHTNPKKKRTYEKETIKGDSNENLPKTVESVSSLEESYHAAKEKWGKTESDNYGNHSVF